MVMPSVLAVLRLMYMHESRRAGRHFTKFEYLILNQSRSTDSMLWQTRGRWNAKTQPMLDYFLVFSGEKPRVRPIPEDK
jgi:hypothetical protein